MRRLLSSGFSGHNQRAKEKGIRNVDRVSYPIPEALGMPTNIDKSRPRP